MDIRVLVLVIVFEPVDHALRLLSSGGVIEPHEWTPMNTLAKNGEVALESFRVERERRKISFFGNIWFNPSRIAVFRDIRSYGAKFLRKPKRVLMR